ncbi:MAG: hypothetical protein AAGN82_06680 [Myxococcota bacterium]
MLARPLARHQTLMMMIRDLRRRAGYGRFALATVLARPWVALHLRRDGWKATLERVEAEPHKRPARALRRLAGDLAAHDAERVVAWVYRRLRLRGACLERALVQFSLQPPGTTRFVIGVQRAGGREREGRLAVVGVRAHAWVESDQRSDLAGSFAPIFLAGRGEGAAGDTPDATRTRAAADTAS